MTSIPVTGLDSETFEVDWEPAHSTKTTPLVLAITVAAALTVVVPAYSFGGSIGLSIAAGLIAGSLVASLGLKVFPSRQGVELKFAIGPEGVLWDHYLKGQVLSKFTPWTSVRHVYLNDGRHAFKGHKGDVQIYFTDSHIEEVKSEFPHLYSTPIVAGHRFAFGPLVMQNAFGRGKHPDLFLRHKESQRVWELVQRHRTNGADTPIINGEIQDPDFKLPMKLLPVRIIVALVAIPLALLALVIVVGLILDPVIN